MTTHANRNAPRFTRRQGQGLLQVESDRLTFPDDPNRPDKRANAGWGLLLKGGTNIPITWLGVGSVCWNWRLPVPGVCRWRRQRLAQDKQLAAGAQQAQSELHNESA